ncbi:serine/threonine-protein kinase [Chondromyces apiculatus]|uniref:Protein kinase domain-containing protein n=1 Tax=Chondromyces apiculatus DSM 436 TaxID=1192034 RepID=A0A017TBI1_9BACT|nr:serine/threonine-protein kinase [Chondromyces apiculatus]EYF06180.1 Hypothetical protein CAP_2370 [Chondromyces apiculatus DSM 436]
MSWRRFLPDARWLPLWTAPGADAHEPLSAGTRLHKYRVTALIAEGGMGQVYEAIDEYLDRPVALKILGRGRARDASYILGQRKEARILADLNHPNIVRLYDAGMAEGGLVYLVMERLDGISLRRLLKRVGRIDVKSALSIALQVVDALRVAHDGGIIHRDLKPENVMLLRDGVVKVVDFGVARRVDGNLASDVFANVGTIHYMAPEQVLGQGATRASDVYAAGLILYELLSGRHAYATTTGELPTGRVVQLNHVYAAPRPLFGSVPELIPESLSALVDRMLAKAPEERPDAETVHAALAEEYALYAAAHPHAEGEFDRAARATPEERRPSARPRDPAPLGEREGGHLASPPLPVSADAPAKPAPRGRLQETMRMRPEEHDAAGKESVLPPGWKSHPEVTDPAAAAGNRVANTGALAVSARLSRPRTSLWIAARWGLLSFGVAVAAGLGMRLWQMRTGAPHTAAAPSAILNATAAPSATPNAAATSSRSRDSAPASHAEASPTGTSSEPTPEPPRVLADQAAPPEDAPASTHAAPAAARDPAVPAPSGEPATRAPEATPTPSPAKPRAPRGGATSTGQGALGGAPRPSAPAAPRPSAPAAPRPSVPDTPRPTATPPPGSAPAAPPRPF